MNPRDLGLIRVVIGISVFVLVIFYGICLADVHAVNNLASKGTPTEFVTVFPFVTLGLISALILIIGYLLKDKDRSLHIKITEGFNQINKKIDDSNKDVSEKFILLFAKSDAHQTTISQHTTEIAEVKLKCNITQKHCPWTNGNQDIMCLERRLDSGRRKSNGNKEQ